MAADPSPVISKWCAVAGAFLALLSQTLAAPTWKLVWSDEFNGPAIDPTKWEFEVNALGGYNNELQYYTDRSENARIENGCLVIEARAEKFTGPEGTRNYTSARMRTLHKGDWKYGRIEVRAKLPQTQSLWPAIWMMPTDQVYGGWPKSGEIDIMELLGHEPAKVYGTIHFVDAKTNAHLSSGASYTLPAGTFADAFHVFALEWEPTAMRWYVDDTLYATQTQWQTSGGPYPAPFDQAFHLLLNVAVGGNWPGNPDGTSLFPQRMTVDYVRVFQPVTTPATPPKVTVPPANTSVAPHSRVALSVVAMGTPPLSYQWYKAQSPIAGATDASLVFADCGPSDAAVYFATVTNPSGSVTTATAQLTVTTSAVSIPAGVFTNLSSRANVNGSADPLITGFVIAGSGAKKLLIRGVGPGLSAFGVPNALADPILTLKLPGGEVLQANDDWTFGDNPTALDAVMRATTFPLSAPGMDAAMIVSLPAGAYTALITAPDGSSGTALAELYDLDPTSSAQLVNLSIRGRVGVAGSVLVAGFSVAGNSEVPTLIRAIGPALTQFGVPDALPDPKLQLTTLTGTTVAANDNWSDPPGNVTIVSAAAQKTGAFPLPQLSADAALATTVTAGPYTAIVSAAGQSSGITLVEVYHLP